jgi:hypothetical protein
MPAALEPNFEVALSCLAGLFWCCRPWRLRPQTPAFGLDGLVLKRRTG